MVLSFFIVFTTFNSSAREKFSCHYTIDDILVIGMNYLAV